MEADWCKLAERSESFLSIDLIAEIGRTIFTLKTFANLSLLMEVYFAK